MLSYLWALLGRDERGQAMTEYALILALVAIVVTASIVLFRDQLGTLFGTLTTALTNAPNP